MVPERRRIVLAVGVAAMLVYLAVGAHAEENGMQSTTVARKSFLNQVKSALGAGLQMARGGKPQLSNDAKVARGLKQMKSCIVTVQVGFRDGAGFDGDMFVKLADKRGHSSDFLRLPGPMKKFRRISLPGKSCKGLKDLAYITVKLETQAARRKLKLTMRGIKKKQGELVLSRIFVRLPHNAEMYDFPCYTRLTSAASAPEYDRERTFFAVQLTRADFENHKALGAAAEDQRQKQENVYREFFRPDTTGELPGADVYLPYNKPLPLEEDWEAARRDFGFLNGVMGKVNGKLSNAKVALKKFFRASSKTVDAHIRDTLLLPSFHERNWDTLSQVRKNWLSDRYFGYAVLSGTDPTQIRRPATLHPYFADASPQRKALLLRILAKGRLYMLDYSQLLLNRVETRNKPVARAVMLFEYIPEGETSIFHGDASNKKEHVVMKGAPKRAHNSSRTEEQLMCEQPLRADLAAGSALIPIAIRLTPTGGFFYPPKGGQMPFSEKLKDKAIDWSWVLARSWVMQMFFLVHEGGSHWMNTHQFVIGPYLAMQMHIPSSHTLHRLYRPHMRHTMFINKHATIDLVVYPGPVCYPKGDPRCDQQPQPPQCVNPLAESGCQGFFCTTNLGNDMGTLLKEYYAPVALMDQDPTSEAKVRNISKDDMPDIYHYLNDGTRVFELIHKYVSGVLRDHYDNNDQFLKDRYVQNWLKALGTQVFPGHTKGRAGGEVRRFPEVKSVNDLIDVVARLIWSATGLHSAVNYQQYSFYAHPSWPAGMRGGIPTQHDPTLTEQDYVNALPSAKLLAKQHFLTYGLSSYSPRESLFIGFTMDKGLKHRGDKNLKDNLAGAFGLYESELFLSHSNKHYVRAKNDALALAKQIVERNAQCMRKQLPGYFSLEPTKRITLSVAI